MIELYTREKRKLITNSDPKQKPFSHILHYVDFYLSPSDLMIRGRMRPILRICANICMHTLYVDSFL